MRAWAGGVAERLIAPVLKTGRPKGLVSSNLTPSVSLVTRHDEAKRITVWHNKCVEIRRCPLTCGFAVWPRFFAPFAGEMVSRARGIRRWPSVRLIMTYCAKMSGNPINRFGLATIYFVLDVFFPYVPGRQR